MKLFAKRTKVEVSPADAEKILQERQAAEEQATREAAEAAVQDLLQMDPAKLNAKQRRMVKRYKDRKPESIQNAQPVASQAGGEQEDEVVAQDQEKMGQCEETESDAQNSNENDQDKANEIEIEDQVSGLTPPEGPEGEGKDAQNSNEIDQDKSNKIEKDVQASELTPLEGPEGDEKEVKKLLEKLNSKHRRKLTRRLEREGSSALKEVYQEATTLLAETVDKLDAEKKAETKIQSDNTIKAKSEEKASGKKRKKDWDSLPPEERLRREEQRRLQKEAAELRAKAGEISGSKQRHPLNSERRRANRRKPKWGKNSAGLVKEHHSSGFHMRKMNEH